MTNRKIGDAILYNGYCPMDKSEFTRRRDEILAILGKYQEEEWDAVRIAASALNEFLASYGHQAKIILHPLLVYHEADDKI